MLRAGIALGVLAGLCVSSAADSLTYENSRFGTRASFPAEIFDTIDPPPENGDGRRFRSADGAELAIYGQFNALDLTPETMIAEARENAAADAREITYDASGGNWAVISGLDGETIFYRRHEFGSDGVIHSMDLRYPASRKSVYDGLVGTIAATLEGP